MDFGEAFVLWSTRGPCATFRSFYGDPRQIMVASRADGGRNPPVFCVINPNDFNHLRVVHGVATHLPQ
jgi:hypothetical protein